MTDSEKREAARQFYQKWVGKGREDEDDRSYWLDILQRILGAADATDRIEFQKKVIVDGNTKRIDAYIPEAKVIIEQKSIGFPLDRETHQSDGCDLTPYEQAKRYNNDLPVSQKARWIVTSNFQEIWIYDMDTNVPEQNVVKLSLADLQSRYSMLDFLLEKKVVKLSQEVELSKAAGILVGRIYDSFSKQYHDPESKKAQESLNILCVRLVFCLYAEDAGLFNDDAKAFSNYIEQYEPKDLRLALTELFKVLDTDIPGREDMYLSDELAAFPFVNGGLFAREDIVIPKITQEIKDTILEAAGFNWRDISPTIFGAVFESTLNPETRRKGGMHYTSIENIHKVIDPLFLDELKNEFNEIKKTCVPKTRNRLLKEFQHKLAGLTFLDPACGSGNFLTETYLSLRRLENSVLSLLHDGQAAFGDSNINPIEISISQFYGIEINDFAVTVAKTALWIAESQMLKETEGVVLMPLDFLPLKTNAYIVEGNALRMNWEDVVPKSKLNYIMGNPPFVGARLMSSEQKKDMSLVFGKAKNINNLDYVSCWYKKSTDMMIGTSIRSALVSTNSITQGEQVSILWPSLFGNGIHIDFAHQTFIWDSEASIKAHVHCVIVGFSVAPNSASRKLFTSDGFQIANNINGYLLDAPIIFVESRKTPLSDVPNAVFGSMPNDGGFLCDFDTEKKNEIVDKYPAAEKMFRKFLGASEFLNNKERWCLWLKDISPADLKNVSPVMDAIQKVKESRENSNRAATKKLADFPTLFGEIRQPDSNYLLIPRTSSENRRYIPIGFMPPTVIASDAATIIPNATLYHFGVLTSNVHNSWIRAVAGRLKSDYRYSGSVVYNNFPWPNPTDEQKAKIEKTAQAILDARALFPDSSLADLYDPLTMPTELLKAHQANDRAVMQAYGLNIAQTSEADCVAFLMRRYQDLTE